MNNVWIIMAFAFSTQVLWAAPSKENVLEEKLYQEYKDNIATQSKSNQLTGFSSFEQSLFVDALWDLVEDGNKDAQKILSEIETFHYDLIQRLRIAIMRIKYGHQKYLPKDLRRDLYSVLTSQTIDVKIIYILAAYEAEILNAGHKKIIELAKTHPNYADISDEKTKVIKLEDQIVADLFHKTPDVTTYMNGEYENSIKIFMFCRINRLYPCLMIMKDVHGRPVRNTNGTLWSNPSLASSSRGLPSYSRNGSTPAGILTIDSVMPEANAQMSFGKSRRIMLNFVPKSRNETLIKSLMPASSHNSDWWKSTLTARDIGRNLLRIHGTGRINEDSTTPYYPFVRTSGCIAQRENTYDGVTYVDQRELLDDVMNAMDMAPVYDNELKIKGILYLMEIDDQNAPVTLNDLELKGIE